MRSHLLVIGKCHSQVSVASVLYVRPYNTLFVDFLEFRTLVILRNLEIPKALFIASISGRTSLS